MGEQQSGGSWWQTLPGILTGIAALVTAVGGLIVAAHQGGLIGKPAAGSAPAVSPDGRPAAANADGGAVAAAPAAPAPAAFPTGDTRTVRAGHYAFKLLDARWEPVEGAPRKRMLRVSLRVTDLVGKSDYVDGNTIRLGVDGAESNPENSINFAVYDHQSVETEALFTVPADASTVSLLLGRVDDAMVRLPLPLPGREPRRESGTAPSENRVPGG